LLVPSRVSTRRTEISAYVPHWPGTRPSVLSNTSSTDARAAGLRLTEPLKITSCIDSPRSSEARDSPRTQRTASMMFDLPQPFGPTTPTSWPGSMKLVGSANDSKPERLMDLRRTRDRPALTEDQGVDLQGNAPSQEAAARDDDDNVGPHERIGLRLAPSAHRPATPPRRPASGLSRVAAARPGRLQQRHLLDRPGRALQP